jgi:hypothetical protein
MDIVYVFDCHLFYTNVLSGFSIRLYFIVSTSVMLVKNLAESVIYMN